MSPHVTRSEVSCTAPTDAREHRPRVGWQRPGPRDADTRAPRTFAADAASSAADGVPHNDVTVVEVRRVVACESVVVPSKGPGRVVLALVLRPLAKTKGERERV